jgi:hypothetical protein
MRGKSSYSFLRSLVKGQDHSFFKDLTGVFSTVGGTLVDWSSLSKLVEVPVFDWSHYRKSFGIKRSDAPNDEITKWSPGFFLSHHIKYIHGQPMEGGWSLLVFGSKVKWTGWWWFLDGIYSPYRTYRQPYGLKMMPIDTARVIRW